MKRTLPVALVLLVGLPLGLGQLTRSLDSANETGPLSDVDAGRMLFTHGWTVNDPLTRGDGLGPVFNGRSCVECHFQGGVGGSGRREHNVTSFTAFEKGKRIDGVVHRYAIAPGFHVTSEMIERQFPIASKKREGPFAVEVLCSPQQLEDFEDLRDLILPRRLAMFTSGGFSEFVPTTTARFSERRTPAIFGAGVIESISERDILLNQKTQIRTNPALAGTVAVAPDGRIGKFGWRAQTASLSEFVQTACAIELGLSNPGHPQPASRAKPEYRMSRVDLSERQCQQLTAFVRSLPPPVQVVPTEERTAVRRGALVFDAIGCAHCHTPDLGNAKGIYSDLLLHRMGPDLASATGSSYGGSFGGSDDEWRTPPLWGVADGGPYLHDGRAPTLESAIAVHAGQADQAMKAYLRLSPQRQGYVLSFLKSLRAPSAVAAK
jgi:CxxC motif-containing protein (DUF1111 family)